MNVKYEFEQNNEMLQVISLSGFDLREGKVQDVCKLAQIDGSPLWHLYT
jgi:hypothetical protein